MLVLTLLVAVASNQTQATNRSEQLVWSRCVGSHFLLAAISGDYVESLAFTTDEFAKRLDLRENGPRPDERALQKLFAPGLREPGTKTRAPSPWPVIDGERLSPSCDEAYFEGEIRSGPQGRHVVLSHFSLILSKTPAGKWRVSSVSITPERK
jgi:hypothetical protein